MRLKYLSLLVLFTGWVSICPYGVCSQYLPNRPEGIERLEIQVEGVIQDVEEKIDIAIKHLDVIIHEFEGG
jgi:hypothetical protein